MAAQIGDTITGPNFTADRNTPPPAPFSRGGNQLLMVVVTPVGSGASATPRPTRVSSSMPGDELRPASAVKADVVTIAQEKSLCAPSLAMAKLEGICPSA